MSRILLFLFTFSFVFPFNHCVRFKVDEMSPNLVTRIRIGDNKEMLEAEILNNTFVNIPLKIPTSPDRLFVTDLKNSNLKVFLKNGKLDYIIGSWKNKPPAGRVLNLKVSSPGLVAVSEEDDIYIQNRVNPGAEIKEETLDPFTLTTGHFAQREPVYIPSYILHINQNKDSTNVIGVSGKNTEPFRYIEDISCGEKGNLFVVHRISEELILSYYKKGELMGKISESNLGIFRDPENANLQIRLEKMLPDRTGNFALLSFSFTGKQDGRFKFRRIYKYKYNSENPVSLLKEFQDPSEILFGIKANKEFYIWETESSGEKIKLQVHDAEGNHTSNKRLAFPAPRIKWRETYMDYKDAIYSIRIDSGYLELYEWK